MFKTVFAALILVWVCLVMGCSTVEVEDDHDHFSSIQ